MTIDYKKLTELYEGELIGKNPSMMSPDELSDAGLVKSGLLRAVREKCIDCCCGNQAEVRKCTSVACPLWVFRMNKNPWSKRELSDEERKILAERLSKSRNLKNSM